VKSEKSIWDIKAEEVKKEAIPANSALSM